MSEIKEYEKYFDEHVKIEEFNEEKTKFTPWKEIEKRINEKVDTGEIKTYYDILKEIGYEDYQISEKTKSYLAKPIFGTNVIDLYDECERSKKKIERLQKDYENLEKAFEDYKRKVEENNKKGEEK